MAGVSNAMSRSPLKRIDVQIQRIRARLYLDPGNAELLQELGKAYIRRFHCGGADLFDAMVALEKSFAANPNDPFTLLYLAYVFTSEGRYAKCLKALHAAAKIAPNLAIVQVHMGDAYWNLGEAILTDECYRKAVALEPEYAVARQRLEWWLGLSRGRDEPKQS